VSGRLVIEAEGRYHRQTLIEWWDQQRVADARVLVIGAGALGNEVLKNLALVGVGNVLVYDMDRIELSNLSRGVLFREEDEGEPKAEVAVRRMRELNPGTTAHARVENVVHRAGLGVFLWADVVIGALDNREARIFTNAACAATGRRWVDGAIEGFSGVVRAFDPKAGACYECTMNETDRNLVADRRSCALLARDLVTRGRVPNTAVTASLIAALQCQEAMKLLHDQPALIGEGLHTDGLWNETSRVRYPVREGCTGHENLGPVTTLGAGSSDVTFGELLERAEGELGEGAVLELSRDIVLALRCPDCGDEEPGRAVLGEVGESRAACPACGAHRLVDIAPSVSRDGDVDLGLTPRELGLPLYDVILARNGLERRSAWLLGGDAAAVLGPLDTGGERERN